MQQFKRDLTQNSNKLHLDKYYTSDETAQYCIDKAREILKNEKVTEVIEPSAGNGAFSKKIKRCIAYDLEPEDDSIIKQDFLELNIPYKEGRLFIGNPPFGARLNLALKFMKKCYSLGDYIAFILPISQLNNTYIFYEFDLIYSQDMGKNIYTDRNIHCCFNIYKRPENGLNKKIKYNFKDFILYDDHNLSTPSSSIINIYKNKTYDFKICAWGAKCGQILNKEESYKKEIIFVINNINKKEEIYNCVKNWDISKVLQTSTPVLPMWKIYKYISENINDIQ
jgi:predicted RNA methylase